MADEPQLSEQTLLEQAAGRKHAEANAAALLRAEAIRRAEADEKAEAEMSKAEADKAVDEAIAKQKEKDL